MTEMTFRIESPEVELGLLGAQDKFVVLLEEGMNVTINPFGTDLKISGEDEDVHLTQNEYKIVALLAQYAGKVLTYDQIIQHVWGPNASGDNRILRVNMANIRRKLEANPAEPQYIFTEIGVGYRMAECD